MTAMLDQYEKLADKCDRLYAEIERLRADHAKLQATFERRETELLTDMDRQADELESLQSGERWSG